MKEEDSGSRGQEWKVRPEKKGNGTEGKMFQPVSLSLFQVIYRDEKNPVLLKTFLNFSFSIAGVFPISGL